MTPASHLMGPMELGSFGRLGINAALNNRNGHNVG